MTKQLRKQNELEIKCNLCWNLSGSFWTLQLIKDMILWTLTWGSNQF